MISADGAPGGGLLQQTGDKTPGSKKMAGENRIRKDGRLDGSLLGAEN
jgi:hypothetical protein